MPLCSSLYQKEGLPSQTAPTHIGKRNFVFICGSIAAAAENENDSKDYNPGAVIIKKMAEAIVVHICSSKVSFELLLISIVCRFVFLVTVKNEKLKTYFFLSPIDFALLKCYN